MEEARKVGRNRKAHALNSNTAFEVDRPADRRGTPLSHAGWLLWGSAAPWSAKASVPKRKQPARRERGCYNLVARSVGDENVTGASGSRVSRKPKVPRNERPTKNSLSPKAPETKAQPQKKLSRPTTSGLSWRQWLPGTHR